MMRFTRLLAALAVLTGASVAFADDSYTLSVAETQGASGQPTRLTVTIKGVNGYKANAEYPNAIKNIKVDAGAKLATDRVDGRVDAGALMFAVEVVPVVQRTTKVTGDIRFSVCNDKSCLVKRVPLAAELPAR